MSQYFVLHVCAFITDVGRAKPWSSVDKEESVACQITSPFNKKYRLFLQCNLFNFIFKNNPSHCRMGKLLGNPVIPIYQGKELNGLVESDLGKQEVVTCSVILPNTK